MAKVQRLTSDEFEGWPIAKGSLKLKGQNKADLTIDPADIRLGDVVAFTVIGRATYVGGGLDNDEVDRCVTITVETITDLAPADLKVLDGGATEG